MDTDDNTPLEGNWIRKNRLALGMTLTEVAEYVGVSPAHLARIEINTARPSLRTLYHLADHLGETNVAERIRPFLSAPASNATLVDAMTGQEELF